MKARSQVGRMSRDPLHVLREGCVPCSYPEVSPAQLWDPGPAARTAARPGLRASVKAVLLFSGAARILPRIMTHVLAHPA